jgi:hypothetical protein
MRGRVPATWAAAVVVPVLGVGAFLGSLSARPVFLPTGNEFPPAVVALVGLVGTTYAIAGAEIASRLPGNAIGWLLLAAGLGTGLTLAGCEYVAVGWPGDAWAAWLVGWVSTVALLVLAYVLLLFPDGHLPSRRWRPALWLADLAVVALLVGAMFSPQAAVGPVPANPVGIAAIAGTPLDQAVLGFVLLNAAIVVGAWSLVVRFRHARGAQRAQLTWLAWAAAVVAVAFAFQLLTWFAGQHTGVDVTALGLVVLVVCFAAIPVACGVAILRYRLYDIDRLVSRTVAYLLLTGIVVGVYAIVVATASAVLPGTPSNFTVSVATLLAAAAFEPARRRVQHLVDRRFNRERYDGYRIVERFADQLRRTIDPARSQRELVAAVAHSLGPASVSLWQPTPIEADHLHRVEPSPVPSVEPAASAALTSVGTPTA